MNEEMDVRTGIVEYYNADKGYGFLKDKETGKTTFFHFSNTNLPPEQIKPLMLASYIISIDSRRGKEQAKEILLCDNP